MYIFFFFLSRGFLVSRFAKESQVIKQNGETEGMSKLSKEGCG